MIRLNSHDLLIGVISGVVAGMVLIIAAGIRQLIYLRISFLSIVFETIAAFVILMGMIIIFLSKTK